MAEETTSMSVGPIWEAKSQSSHVREWGKPSEAGEPYHAAHWCSHTASRMQGVVLHHLYHYCASGSCGSLLLAALIALH